LIAFSGFSIKEVALAPVKTGLCTKTRVWQHIYQLLHSLVAGIVCEKELKLFYVSFIKYVFVLFCPPDM